MPFPDAEKESTDALFAMPESSIDEIFAMEFTKLGGKFVFCNDDQALLDNLVHLADSRGWQEILCAENHILKLAQKAGLQLLLPTNPDHADAPVALTGCEVVVARTGSVIVSSKQHHGRTASIFYPVHIIVAYANQVVQDIQQGLDVFPKVYGTDLPSMISLSSGPSRTADIEKTLVVGVHGPGEVFLFYVNRPYVRH